ncbi:MAG: hypothetical protein KDC18_03625 [Alphaproteobacteria bacterium]|nr:hypothetical protein [Alphaproteobacteria bacterium]MCB9928409.1 hypothetical protein [Alphaproteobacteria bacterium]
MGFIALAYLPVLALLAWSARRGDLVERVLFVVNLLALWASAIWLIGYPALIVPALCAAGGFLVFLVFATAGDGIFTRRRPT